MNPFIAFPVALVLAWATARKPKRSKKTEPPRPVADEPKPFPGPSGGPKPPERVDPSPIEIHPGTTAEQIEAHPHAGHGLFISSDCETVFVGERWYSDVFLPRARRLVLEHPHAFHHPIAVLYELLVAMPTGEGFIGPAMIPHRDHVPTTPTGSCVQAWGQIFLGDFTPLGTYSGWISARSDPDDLYREYSRWYRFEYPELWDFLETLSTTLWVEPDLQEVFESDWPEDRELGDIHFDPRAGVRP